MSGAFSCPKGQLPVDGWCYLCEAHAALPLLNIALDRALVCRASFPTKGFRSPEGWESRSSSQRYFSMPLWGWKNKKSLAMTYFPTPQGGSIIGVRGLDFRVRNGNGYNTSTIITRQLIT